MVKASLRVRVVGASGAVEVEIGIEAPLPSDDAVESPIELIAVTLAMTESVSPRSNGDASRVETGIVHSVADMIPLSFSASQLLESIEKVDVEVLTSSL